MLSRKKVSMRTDSALSRLLASLAGELEHHTYGMSEYRPVEQDVRSNFLLTFFRQLLAALANEGTRARPDGGSALSPARADFKYSSDLDSLYEDDVVYFGPRIPQNITCEPTYGYPKRPRNKKDLTAVLLTSFGVAVALLLGITIASEISPNSYQITNPSRPAPFIFKGKGFDSRCPMTVSQMARWRQGSPYRAVFVEIGGANASCSSRTLTADWVREVESQGWTVFPVYAGPQASLGEIKAAAAQGIASARDTRAQLRKLNFPANVPVFYSMQAYPATDNGRFLRFINAWDRRINSYGYYSGVYSNDLSGIQALITARGQITEPNVAWDALWDGNPNERSPEWPSNVWHDRYVRQYLGGQKVGYGGVSLRINYDQINIRLHSLNQQG
jgi:Domain of unknown function (DUF1906)